jgi:hypothetical protein
MATSSLIFFNNQGDNLNLRWSNTDEKWEGDLIFDENGNDTFKTIGMYMFERIPSFEYENPGNLKLDKFQLFNEYRFDISGSSYLTQSVVKIETTNNDPNFYSKWIYGEHFEVKYPIGSQIIFTTPIYEFNNTNKTYTVVQTKKDAILVISDVSNSDFNTTWIGGATLSNITISGVNAIGIYNYLTTSLGNNLSSWSEPDFYSKWYNGRKLTLVNTTNNDGVITINNSNLFDRRYYKYTLDVSSITQSDGVTAELVLKTDLPVVYTGSLILNDYLMTFGTPVPDVIKTGTEFTVQSSTLNTNAIVVDYIPSFLGNVNLMFYATQSLVTFNNRIYECIQAYTWSATASIDPTNSSYWTYSYHLPVTEPLLYESITSTEVHLTTNKIRFYQAFTQSSIVTFASLAQAFYNDFKFYGVNLYYQNSALHADLLYPTLFAQVNYYSGLLGTQSLGTSTFVYESNIGVKETLIPESNVNTNQNFYYNIVFTDLDEYGFKIKINGQVYQQEIDWVYVGLYPDLPRTIDKTIRSWMTKWYVPLMQIGIICSLHYVGSFTSIYFNSINIKTEYPNVPLIFTVEVGTTANYYIQHSEVVFYDTSNYLNISILGNNYGQSVGTVSGTSSLVYDIPTALSSWVSTYKSTLVEYGIYVSSINNMLVFNVKDQTFDNGGTPLSYTITTGKSSLPGINQYVISNKMGGHFGALMASNELILPSGPSFSFINEPFATGQIVAINNTVRPYDNQEYNILYFDPTNIVLSYQGPFWATTDPRCDVGPFVTLAFNGGFSATGCPPPFIPPVVPIGGGQFDYLAFTSSFSLRFATTNLYNTLDLYLTDTNIVDITYLQLTSSIYVFGNQITVVDSFLSSIIQTISLPGVTGSISMTFNPINNYLYCLSSDRIIVFDPIVYTYRTIMLSSVPMDCKVNTTNGDIYVTYQTAQKVDIWSSTNFSSSPTSTITLSVNTYNLSYNDNENCMYFTTNGDIVYRVSGTSRLVNATYSITGLLPTIFYEPINSAIYVFGSANLYVINNSVITPDYLVTTESFNDLLFNNTVGVVVSSQSDRFVTIPLGSTATGFAMTSYGYLAISQYDGDVYIASQNTNQYFVIDTINQVVKQTGSIGSKIKKMVYNPDRKSMYGIQPSQNKLIEIQVTLTSTLELNPMTFSTPSGGQYGTLNPNYVPHPDTWLKTREYIRRPRENYSGEPQVQYVWKWIDDQKPQMFLYDFSGNQLPTTGSLAYVGPKPLDVINLNLNPNNDISKTDSAAYQQTIFDTIVETLDYIDSDTDLSFVPEPIETFIGFRSDDEGYMSSTLNIFKREYIDFTITTSLLNQDIINFSLVTDEVNGNYGLILLNVNSQDIFTQDSVGNTRGVKPGQLIQIFINDITNIKHKYKSLNNGKKLKIRQVYSRTLVVDFIETSDAFVDEYTQIDDYPTTNKTTYLSTRIVVLDKPLATFNISGQTEIEDVRYKIELSNVGQNINAEDVYIFKSYDINEQGVDWGFLNRKRKEMMMVRHDIFPYIGAYKSIINAINYFGYNDLELYEYYRNINIKSPLFYQLFKVEIPDIFDNSVQGFTVNDFLKHTMPNPNYETTNLFNLTYNITDREGNNVLLYSLQEVIIKLEGLKYWLERNIIPITHRILDITGRADFVGQDAIVHRNYDVKILNVRQSMTPVDFKMNEAYLQPVNSGSTVYTCHVDFYIADDNAPDYFTVKVRTYKTYLEWYPFNTYGIGDNVTYYGKVYESVINNNKLKNPRKYESTPSFNLNTDYILGQFTNYNQNIYEYIGTQSWYNTVGTQSSTTPLQDILTNGSFASWLDVTEWKFVPFVPVQTITEYRTGTQSFNFTIDSNIDPFITIEVTSDNGYGQNYTSKKNYEVRGLNDLFTGITNLDPLGPFVPITPILTPGP